MTSRPRAGDGDGALDAEQGSEANELVVDEMIYSVVEALSQQKHDRALARIRAVKVIQPEHPRFRLAWVQALLS